MRRDGGHSLQFTREDSSQPSRGVDLTDFLDRHAASVESVNADPATAAALVVKAGIVAKEAIAEKAIPACNVVCIEGDDMKTALSGYLQVLYDADPSSVGGSLPGEDFYYLG